MFKNYKKIFFIGIGGIGMSALAKYFLNKDKIIYGYDILRSDICISLEKKGSKITYCQKNLDFILDNNLFKDQESCLIVYTPAIKNDNIFLKFFIENNFNVKKRSEILSEICEKKFLVAVAGTHGKTTTTSIISHILNSTDFNITAFIGGISRNENSNLIGGEIDSKLIIVEADEYDKSFLKLSPNIAIITSVDMDHSDIYTKTSSLKKAYHQFISNIASDGVLIIENKALQELGNINFSNIITYSFSEDTDFRISSYEITNRNSRFNFINSNSNFFFNNEIVFCLPGKHNILNALASILVCIQLDVKKEDIVKSINSFLGIKRRFEIHFESKNKVFVDDYAHHPSEIKETLETLFEMYPNRKLTLIFQPHLYTRTRDFMNEFADVLSLPNHLLLLDIFPAREKPIKGIDSSRLLKKCRNKNKELVKKETVLNILNKSDFDVLVTMGAGNISSLVEQIKNEYFVK